MKGATLLILFSIVLSTPCLAEVYHCDGKWTNKPCDETIKPLEGLRPLSKVSAAPEEVIPAAAPQEEASAADPEKESEQVAADEKSAVVPVADCRVVSSGYDLRLMGVYAHKTGGADRVSTYIKGTVVNHSDRRIGSPVYVQVQKSNRYGGEQTHLVTKSLQARSSAGFSVLAARSASSEYRAGDYRVSLAYAPARNCDSVTVSAGNTAPRRRSEYEGGAQMSKRDSYGVHKQTLKNLDLLEREVRELEQKFRKRKDRHDSERQRAKINIESRLNGVCARSRGNTSVQISRACLDLGKRIRKLGR